MIGEGGIASREPEMGRSNAIKISALKQLKTQIIEL